MNNKAKRPPLLLIFFFLIAIGLVVFMMFVVQSNARVIGSPGKTSTFNNLRYSFTSGVIWMSFRNQKILTP